MIGGGHGAVNRSLLSTLVDNQAESGQPYEGSSLLKKQAGSSNTCGHRFPCQELSKTPL
jgi:hypothetical protein